MKKLHPSIPCLATLAALLLTVGSSRADLISHYLFTDGNLLDNEVPAGPALLNAGSAAVTLGAGTAVFTAETNLTNVNYLISDNTSEFNLGSFTVSFWLKTGTVDQGGSFQGIFSSNGSNSDANSWQYFSDGNDDFGTTATDGNMRIRGGGGSIGQTDSPILPLHSPDTWYYVALTSNDTDDRILITISSIGGSLGDLANGVIYEGDVQIDEFVFGANRALNQTYGMEMANIRIYDEVQPAPVTLERRPLCAAPGPAGDRFL